MEHLEHNNTLYKYIINGIKKVLKIEENESTLLSIFLFGSRLYDINKPESDWDSLIVCRNLHLLNLTSTKENPSKEMKTFVPGLLRNLEIMQKFEIHLLDIQIEVPKEINPNGTNFINIDLNIYDLEIWRLLVLYQVDWALVCHFLPKHKILYNIYPDEIIVNKRRCFHEKRFVHILRYGHFTLQLMKFGTIIDHTEGNAYWKDEVMEKQLDWKEYQKWFKSKFQYISKEGAKIFSQLSNTPLKQSSKPRIVQFIIEYGIKELTQRLGIDIKELSQNILEIRSSIDSPIDNEAVQECIRGIIIDVSNILEPQIICWPFSGTWKIDSLKNLVIDEKLRAYEKLDGVLVTLYWNNEKWNILTQDNIDSLRLFSYAKRGAVRFTRELSDTYSGKNIAEELGICRIIEKEKKKFNEIFWEAWENKKYQLPKDKNCCYMFEFVSPQHRVVVPYKKERIVLVGVRNLSTFSELNFEEVAFSNNWEYLKPIFLASNVGSTNFIDFLKQKLLHLSIEEHEGFVVCDSNQKRISLSSPSYNSMIETLSTVLFRSHPKENISEDKISENKFVNAVYPLIVLESHDGNWLKSFPEIEDKLTTLMKAYIQSCKEIDAEYEKLASSAKDLKSLTNQNEFQKSKNQNLMVIMYKAKCNSLRELFKDSFYTNNQLIKKWIGNLTF